MNETEITLTSRSPAQTRRIARDLVGQLPGAAVVALYGSLGSGKTCFVQGMAAALGIPAAVTSPTFTLINEYPGVRPLYHIDLYRIPGPEALGALDFEDYLEPDGITAIEWPERAGDLLPPQTVRVYFSPLPRASFRRIRIVRP